MPFGFWTRVGRMKRRRCGLMSNYFDHLLLLQLYVLLLYWPKNPNSFSKKLGYWKQIASQRQCQDDSAGPVSKWRRWSLVAPVPVSHCSIRRVQHMLRTARSRCIACPCKQGQRWGGWTGCISSNILIGGCCVSYIPQIFCRLWCHSISNKQWPECIIASLNDTVGRKCAGIQMHDNMSLCCDSISTDRILNLFWGWDISPTRTPAITFLHTRLSPAPRPPLIPHPPK